MEAGRLHGLRCGTVKTFDQSVLLAKITRRLSRDGFPRLHMPLILAASGFAAFLACFSLLRLGVDKMALRYPLAVVAGYLVFFLLLKLWLVYQKRSATQDLLDLVDSPCGDFPGPRCLADSDGGGGGWTDCLSGFDWDECAVVLILLAALLVALVGALIIIYSAPALMAEALLDAAVIAGLRNRMLSHQGRHWTLGVFRRTLVPMLLVALTFSIAGFAIEHVRPGTRSVGDMWKSNQDRTWAAERQTMNSIGR